MSQFLLIEQAVNSGSDQEREQGARAATLRLSYQSLLSNRMEYYTLKEIKSKRTEYYTLKEIKSKIKNNSELIILTCQLHDTLIETAKRIRKLEQKEKNRSASHDPGRRFPVQNYSQERQPPKPIFTFKSRYHLVPETETELYQKYHNKMKTAHTPATRAPSPGHRTTACPKPNIMERASAKLGARPKDAAAVTRSLKKKDGKDKQWE